MTTPLTNSKGAVCKFWWVWSSQKNKYTFVQLTVNQPVVLGEPASPEQNVSGNDCPFDHSNGAVKNLGGLGARLSSLAVQQTPTLGDNNSQKKEQQRDRPTPKISVCPRQRRATPCIEADIGVCKDPTRSYEGKLMIRSQELQDDRDVL